MKKALYFGLLSTSFVFCGFAIGAQLGFGVVALSFLCAVLSSYLFGQEGGATIIEAPDMETMQVMKEIFTLTHGKRKYTRKPKETQEHGATPQEGGGEGTMDMSGML
jgi:hypothetical protein